MRITPEMTEACSGIALLCDDAELSQRLIVAMENDDRDEAEHVSALMVVLLYGKGDEAARSASWWWSAAFSKCEE